MGDGEIETGRMGSFSCYVIRNYTCDDAVRK